MKQDKFEMDDFKSHLLQLLDSFNENINRYLPVLSLEIERLINLKCIDKNIIENTLDVLLSLTMHGFADDLFIKLLEYYKTVDAEGALFYWNEYDNAEE